MFAALREAEKVRTPKARYSIGAIMADADGNIASKGHNKNFGFRNLTRFGHTWSIHAEMDALRKLKYPQGFYMFVARVGMGLAAPCVICMPVLQRSGLVGVYFSGFAQGARGIGYRELKPVKRWSPLPEVAFILPESIE